MGKVISELVRDIVTDEGIDQYNRISRRLDKCISELSI